MQTTGTIDGVSVYRSPLIPSVNTNALSVAATTLGLPGHRRTRTRPRGPFLNAATAREPVCVLGAAAAQLLGIDRSTPERISAGNRALTSPAASIRRYPQRSTPRPGRLPVCERYLRFDGNPR